MARKGRFFKQLEMIMKILDVKNALGGNVVARFRTLSDDNQLPEEDKLISIVESVAPKRLRKGSVATVPANFLRRHFPFSVWVKIKAVKNIHPKPKIITRLNGFEIDFSIIKDGFDDDYKTSFDEVFFCETMEDALEQLNNHCIDSCLKGDFFVENESAVCETTTFVEHEEFTLRYEIRKIE